MILSCLGLAETPHTLSFMTVSLSSQWTEPKKDNKDNKHNKPSCLSKSKNLSLAKKIGMTAVTRSAQKRKASSTTPKQSPSPSRLFRSVSSSNKKVNQNDKLLSDKINLPTITANDINQRAAILFPGDGIIQGVKTSLLSF